MNVYTFFKLAEASSLYPKRIKVKRTKGISIEEYQNHRDNYDGYCTDCDEVTQTGGVEPDARKYECPVCGKMTVMGIEEALMEGYVN